jgi:hypothetical protein
MQKRKTRKFASPVRNVLKNGQLQLHVSLLDIKALCYKNHQLKNDGPMVYTSYEVVTLTSLHKQDKLQTT